MAHRAYAGAADVRANRMRDAGAEDQLGGRRDLIERDDVMPDNLRRGIHLNARRDRKRRVLPRGDRLGAD